MCLFSCLEVLAIQQPRCFQVIWYRLRRVFLWKAVSCSIRVFFKETAVPFSLPLLSKKSCFEQILLCLMSYERLDSFHHLKIFHHLIVTCLLLRPLQLWGRRAQSSWKVFNLTESLTSGYCVVILNKLFWCISASSVGMLTSILVVEQKF